MRLRHPERFRRRAPLRRLAAFAAAFGLLSAAAPRAQQPEIDPDLPITLHAETNRGSYWIGEPILLTVRLTNWLSPVLSVNALLGVASGGTQVRVFESGRLGEPIRSFYPQSARTSRQIALAYGKAVEVRESVGYEPGAPSGMLFPEAGVERLFVQQSLVYSNPLDRGAINVPHLATDATMPVEIIEPPEAYAGALEILRAHPALVRAMNQVLASPGDRRLLMQIADEHAGSRYAPFCLHAVANYYELLGQAHGALRARAVPLYRRILEEYPAYPRLNGVKVALATILREHEHRLDDAFALAREVVRDDEDNLQRFSDADVLAPLYGKGVNPYDEHDDYAWELFGVTKLMNASETETPTQ